ncbi:MAG: class I SAM-dependent methyltransferase [Patescibacteria group bacterium]
MLLNKIEFAAMNNPVWGALQRLLVSSRWLPHSSLVRAHPRILEIGCGSGRGTHALWKFYSPREIYGIDLDEQMIQNAKRFEKENVHFEIGNASQLEFPDNSFDAVFDSGVLHHLSDWRDCVRECYRVLNPGGVMYIMDFSIETFTSPVGNILKHFSVHPYREMYHAQELVEYFKQVGFEISHYTRHNSLHLLKNFTLIAKK